MMSWEQDDRAVRQVTMKGARGEAVITLSRKHGVWFITEAIGCLGLGGDFGMGKDSWGITEHALRRVEKRLGMEVIKDEVMAGELSSILRGTI